MTVEGEGAVAAGRELERIESEHRDELSMLGGRLRERTDAARTTAEAAQARFQQLGNRVREIAAERRDGPATETTHDFTPEDEELSPEQQEMEREAGEFADALPTSPRAADTTAGSDGDESVRPEPEPAVSSPAPTRRRVRPPADDFDDEDMSERTWLR